MKKVGKYLIITLLMLLGLCCVGVLYLFFIPNSSIFNITYINQNKISKVQATTEVSGVVLNSNAYDIDVVSADVSVVKLEVFANSFGFVLTKNEHVEITTTTNNNTITFNVKEPYGFATTNNSYIKLTVPSNKGIDLTISNKSARTTLDSEKLVLNNLTYSTQSGDLNFNNGSINGNMNLDLNKSTFKLSKNVNTNNNDVQLKITKGSFEVDRSVLGNVEILSNQRGIITIKECARLEMNSNESGGRIFLDKASYVNILSSDTDISINEVSNVANIEIFKTGNVSIRNLKAPSFIKSNSGKIYVSNAESDLTVHSGSGDIVVSSAKTAVSTKTTSGNITINFNENALSYQNAKTRVLYAEIHNGSLTATGVEHIGSISEDESAGIKITGKGKVYLNMRDVCGNNSINSINGELLIIVNNLSVYTLTTSSISGNVKVNLTQTIESGGYTTRETTTTYVNSYETNPSINSFTISSQGGNLTVLDTNFAK